jgi:hypothetical protein
LLEGVQLAVLVLALDAPALLSGADPRAGADLIAERGVAIGSTATTIVSTCPMPPHLPQDRKFVSR